MLKNFNLSSKEIESLRRKNYYLKRKELYQKGGKYYYYKSKNDNNGIPLIVKKGEFLIDFS